MAYVTVLIMPTNGGRSGCASPRSRNTHTETAFAEDATGFGRRWRRRGILRINVNIAFLGRYIVRNVTQTWSWEAVGALVWRIEYVRCMAAVFV